MASGRLATRASVAPERRAEFESLFEATEVQLLDVLNTSGKVTLQQKDLSVAGLANIWRGGK